LPSGEHGNLHDLYEVDATGIKLRLLPEELMFLPTWLWLAGGWAPTSATATVPGFSVTATATPTSVTWSMILTDSG
jgi:hypothetical protein